MAKLSALLSELTRRKVWLFGGIYLALGWVLLQVAIAVETTLSLPGWVDQITLVLLGLGFPVALLLAWAQESNPAGGTQGQPELEGSGALLFNPQDGVPSFSVAILPLNNMSDERAYEWIADGISEDITTRIASHQTMPVAARNSAFAWKDTSPDMREVGKALNVRFVLEGSLRPVGDELRITAQLIDTGTGNHIWTSSYRHPAANLAEMQDEVVDVISIDVYNSILSHELARLRALPRSELTPFDLTQMAIDIVWYRAATEEGLQEAMELAEAAVEKDPGNFFALGTLAQICALRSSRARLYLPGHPQDNQKADEFERKSIEHLSILVEMAPQDFWTLNRASGSLGQFGRYDEALRHARKAVDLYPDRYIAWGVLANLLISTGEYEEAQDALDRFDILAGSQTPAYLGWQNARSRLLIGRRDFVSVEEVAREVLSVEDLVWPRLHLIVALAQQGKLDEARSELVIWKGGQDAGSLEAFIEAVGRSSSDDAWIDTFVESFRLAGWE